MSDLTLMLLAPAIATVVTLAGGVVIERIVIEWTWRRVLRRVNLAPEPPGWRDAFRGSGCE